MDYSTTYVIAAVIALTSEYSQQILKYNLDIRVECLCWIFLYIAIGLRCKLIQQPTVALDNGILPQEQKYAFNWITWSTSICIAGARVLMVHHDTELAMPMTVAFLSIALQYRASQSPTLPEPGGHNKLLRSASKLRHYQQLSALGLLCLFFLYHFSDLLNGSSALVMFFFVMARSSAFVLLETCRDNNLHLPLLQMLEAIVFRVSFILIGALLVFPPSSMLAWLMVLRALFTAAGLAATGYLVMGGQTFAAATIDSYSTAAMQSLLADTFQASLLSPLISVLSLVWGVIHLPPSTTRRRVFAMAVIPILPILMGYSVLWHLESYQLRTERHLSTHPIRHLAAKADFEFNAMVDRQSRTLSACCAEYERRYGRKPPPNFDKWFQAAQKENFLLVDEFDSMMSGLEPLWGVAPSDIRARIENVIEASRGQGMYRFTVNQRTRLSFDDPAAWNPQIFNPWFDSEVLETLPNMTLAMNTMDEAKVVVPHDMLSHALNAASNRHKTPVLPGINPEIAQHVDLLSIGQQNTWDALSLSCAPDTMARDFSLKAEHSPFLTEIGFLSNVTLGKDVCQFPELHKIHAGLRHPASMTITHSLVPVFSQAKASCFNDILYPSLFYAEKLRTREYKEREDMDWEEKDNIVYWTGSNTGGHSTSENWRSLQRQRLVLMMMDESHPINLLHRLQQPDKRSPDWVPVTSTVAAISNSTRVRISAAIQCDDIACKEQNDVLHILHGERDGIDDGYRTRYNLDLDGNGLSGRFYRLLMSKSAVMKQTLYQEWHDDWLIPWVHYIPVSMDLRDFPEIVRYFTQEEEGQALGKRIAESSHEWSRRVLRSEDMRLFWWRLMLEYGRLVNDNRE